eukprot:TRINITY_DN47381_c0_g1_i1.p1 TRINITY_DN47381_c0_g1~~TRINITY_DN47381_c0_g1_i1.p1  ORF type:complete len:281 (+),score=102.97 TRINITY_DN47381_c0_g1_i1:77-919(+)
MVRWLQLIVDDNGWVAIQGQPWHRHREWPERHEQQDGQAWYEYEEHVPGQQGAEDMMMMKSNIEGIEMAVGKLTDKIELIEGMLNERKERVQKKGEKDTVGEMDKILELQKMFLKLESTVNTIAIKIDTEKFEETVTKMQDYDKRFVQFESECNCKYATLTKYLDEKCKECMDKAAEVARTLRQRNADFVMKARELEQKHDDLKFKLSKMEDDFTKKGELTAHQKQILSKLKTTSSILWKTLVLLCDDGIDDDTDIDYTKLKYKAYDALCQVDPNINEKF